MSNKKQRTNPRPPPHRSVVVAMPTVLSGRLRPGGHVCVGGHVRLAAGRGVEPLEVAGERPLWREL